MPGRKSINEAINLITLTKLLEAGFSMILKMVSPIFSSLGTSRQTTLLPFKRWLAGNRKKFPTVFKGTMGQLKL